MSINVLRSLRSIVKMIDCQSHHAQHWGALPSDRGSPSLTQWRSALRRFHRHTPRRNRLSHCPKNTPTTGVQWMSTNAAHVAHVARTPTQWPGTVQTQNAPANKIQSRALHLPSLRACRWLRLLQPCHFLCHPWPNLLPASCKSLRPFQPLSKAVAGLLPVRLLFLLAASAVSPPDESASPLRSPCFS